MLRALMGGALIGLAATWFWFANGRVAGVSGIVRGALRAGPQRRELLLFLAGLLTAGLASSMLGRAPTPAAGPPLVGLALAGGLVGLGTRLAGGCTSGHGVCGIARLSPRSVIATLTFVVAGAATVFLVRHGLPTWSVR